MIELTASSYPLHFPSVLSNNAVAKLEQALASHLGYKEVIALDCIESTFSLTLATLEKDSDALCSPNATTALFNALSHQNLHANYCDLKLDGTMETRFFDKSKSEQTKALVLSHNHGVLSDCKQAFEFADNSKLTFIEDATQAFAKREKSGAEIVIYSLDTLVPSSIANGAFIATDNTVLANSLRKKTKGGYEQKKFWNYDLVTTDADLGLSPLTAQLALDALTNIDKREERTKEIQSIYLEKLSSNRLIELPKPSDLVPPPPTLSSCSSTCTVLS